MVMVDQSRNREAKSGECLHEVSSHGAVPQQSSPEMVIVRLPFCVYVILVVLR